MTDGLDKGSAEWRAHMRLQAIKLDVLRRGDVAAFMMLTGMANARAAEAGLHKARYETIRDIPDALRHASRVWLEANGFSRLRGFPWPPQGVLPGNEEGDAL